MKREGRKEGTGCGASRWYWYSERQQFGYCLGVWVIVGEAIGDGGGNSKVTATTVLPVPVPSPFPW
uniref:Uncharacterized protein n=1 Tax=Oryza punctata TaxID=4537 RepID=A0A0E0M8U7_ORYPU